MPLSMERLGHCPPLSCNFFYICNFFTNLRLTMLDMHYHSPPRWAVSTETMTILIRG
jgi:hypothetical protein